MKKTRAPSQPRTEAPKTSRVRRKSPLNEGSEPQGQYQPILPPSRSSGVTVPSVDPSHSGNGVVQSIEPANSQNSEIDNLTSGLKKIKLNLTTKAQREAKDPSKPKVVATKPPKKTTSTKPKPQAAEQAGSTCHPPVSAQPAASYVSPYSDAEPKSLCDSVPHSPSITQPTLPAHLPNHIQVASQVTLPFSSPAGPTFTQPAPQKPPAAADVFIPYQPEGPPAATMVHQEAVRWLPPNTSTPTPMKRNELPIFTATSAIPFGIRSSDNLPLSSGESRPVEAKKLDDSIWEVPETPQKKL